MVVFSGLTFTIIPKKKLILRIWWLAIQKYVFTLTNEGTQYQLFDMATQLQDEFRLEKEKRFVKNVISQMVLLTGAEGEDSWYAMCRNGKVKSFSMADEAVAKFVFQVADHSSEYEISEIGITFEKLTQWLPREVYCSVTLQNGARTVKYKYEYRDWTNMQGCLLPKQVVVETERSTEVLKEIYAISDELSQKESEGLKRFWLSDFGLPEPNVNRPFPYWLLLIIVGSTLVGTAYWVSQRNKRKL